jgi:hypothetical protein
MNDRRIATRVAGKRFVTGVLAMWISCAWPANAGAHETPHSNWTSADAPCAKYDDLRTVALGDIGVKIDATEPWADEFRHALIFWNTILAANFHEEPNINACAVRIVNGGPDILSTGTVARSQLTELGFFRGMIVVNPEAVKTLNRDEMYATAVHEFGHLLGLQHNSSSHSVMYFLNVGGTEVLDRTDISDLRTRHKVRATAVSAGFLPINIKLAAMPDLAILGQE